jgi:Ni,Fe-hydrogenase III small subunit
VTVIVMNVVMRAIPNLAPLRRRRGVRRPFAIRRSLFIRHVDGGSSNIAELELTSLIGPIYNLAGYGVRLVASPCHANVLLLTGPLTRNMLAPAEAAFAAMPEPRYVVTLGDGATQLDPSAMTQSFRRSYAIVDLPAQMRDAVVAHVPGDPPEPQAVIDTLVSVARIRSRSR